MSLIENRRLLVVDDEEEIRNGYRHILTYERNPGITSSRIIPPIELSVPIKPSDFEIFEAESGDQALEILLEELKRNRRFAGALVDVRMPGKLDGLQFIQEAWKHDPELIVVVVTAYQDRSVDEIARMFGIPFQDQWDYLNKPFTSGEIIQKARHLVSSWNRKSREKEYIQQIKEQQQTLISQERLAAVGRLARSVGHEFGNVLQPLLTKLDLVQIQVRAGHFEKLDESLDEMIEAVTLGASICQDLLTFSRESSEPLPSIPRGTEPSKISLLSAVQKALRLLRHEVKKRDVELQVTVPENLLASAEESKVVQMVINLCKNSLDSIQVNGKIEIHGYSDHDSIILQISDNGKGIPDSNLSHIFQPLFTTKGSSGNGLGLVTCKQIMEEFGGKISLKSKEGQGTIVGLEFKK